MMTPIETKQESVRSDHIRGSYENGVKAVLSVQLAKWASCTEKSFLQASSKSRCDRSVPDGSNSQHENIASKVEFSDHSIDPEEVDAYWTARGKPKYPRPGIWRTASFHANPVVGCPSRSCPNGLDAIWSFCKVPELVEFRLPIAGEVAESPSDSYFTCFKVYLMQCHLWFPVSETIVRLFSRFGLGFSQIKPCTLSGFWC
ncbi:hypothetical protein F2Q68_00010411 [Brassica cretica]|uniref:Uncharacterized protein n=1 Tax=Brassica cretica TaxID=69181 RepID=A0A8S9KZS9_BRACR|nr:hypothetical protein F2Q68_00010411 [Brassica cretica]